MALEAVKIITAVLNVQNENDLFSRKCFVRSVFEGLVVKQISFLKHILLERNCGNQIL